MDGPSRGYPLVRMTAKELAKGRIALVGEAAHVMPPIGAQGLNLGIRDAAVLAEKLSTPDTVRNDADRALSAYQRARRTDIGTRIAAVDLLRVFGAARRPRAWALRDKGCRAVAPPDDARRHGTVAGLRVDSARAVEWIPFS